MTRQKQIRDPVTIGLVIERDLRDKIIKSWSSPTDFLRACIDHSLGCKEFNKKDIEISKIKYQWAFDFIKDIKPTIGLEGALKLLKVSFSWSSLNEDEKIGLEESLRTKFDESWGLQKPKDSGSISERRRLLKETIYSQSED